MGWLLLGVLGPGIAGVVLAIAWWLLRAGTTGPLSGSARAIRTRNVLAAGIVTALGFAFWAAVALSAISPRRTTSAAAS